MATIYGGYAKSNGENFIKVYLTYTVSSSNTKVTVDWSAGCHIDSGHRTNAKITVSCWGESKTVDNTGWEGGNHKMVYGSGDGWDRTTSAYTKTVTAKLTLANGNTSSVTATINIPALQSWNVTYNANGGTGAPATQKKYYNKTLTLSSTKPTKSGYTFVGWNTSSSATSSNHNPGSTYSTNNTLSLYAIWKKTITITYNANGGSGAPASQSQTIYNSTTSARFTIPSTRPTKTKYNFLGWATSATATSASYNYNTAYNFSNSTTLYAVWKLAYISPQIENSSIRAIRTATNSASDTEEADNGEYIYLSFTWTAGSIDGGTTTQAPQCKITATANGSSSVEYGPAQLTQTPFTYKFSTAYSADTPVSVQIELYDTGYETYKLLKTVTVATAIYPQDLIVNNKNVYMGIMHPAVQGQPLTLRGAVIDGNLSVSGNVTDGSGNVLANKKVVFSDAFSSGNQGYTVTVASLAGSTYLGQAIELGSVVANKYPLFNGFDILGSGTARIHTLGHYVYKNNNKWYAFVKMRNDNTSAITNFTVTAYIAWITV